MSKQCLSIEQMQHLKDLGIDTSKKMMCYRRITRDFRGEEKVGRWSLVINQPIIVSNFETYEEVPTFTLQDILDLLPNKVDDELILFVEKGKHKWRIGYTDISSDEIFEDFSDKNFIDAAYEMLCWVIENGYLKVKQDEGI